MQGKDPGVSGGIETQGKRPGPDPKRAWPRPSVCRRQDRPGLGMVHHELAQKVILLGACFRELPDPNDRLLYANRHTVIPKASGDINPSHPFWLTTWNLPSAP